VKSEIHTAVLMRIKGLSDVPVCS